MIRRACVAALVGVLIAGPRVGADAPEPAGKTALGVSGTAFTVNGKATFLLGVSYYAGLGAPEETLKRDLDDVQRHGFNWLRVWATWAAFGHDVSAVDAEGRPRAEQLRRLQRLVAECDH